MKRSFWALPLCILCASVVIVSAGAQRGGKGPGGGGPGPLPGSPSGPQTPGSTVDGPFTLGNRTWPSKAAWIAAGGYCGTPVPSDQVALAVEAAIANGKVGSPIPGRSRRMGRGFHAVNRTVNVWFHVIMDSQGNGNISDSDLQLTIDSMNQAFAGQQPRNPLFKISAQESGNVPFRFQIAGIERITNDVWYTDGDPMAMKAALRVGGAADLNVYTNDLVANTGLLGYAWFPFWYVGGEIEDGIVIEQGSFVNGSYPGYNSGDVLTHETGHWVGLFHTFQGSCFRPGDSVTDTPAEAGPYWWSPNQTGYPDTCTILAKNLPQTASPGRDPVENFMDYSAEDTKYQFSVGQAVRADSLMRIFRGI